MRRKVGDWYQYSGAIHIHTTESDGTKPIEEVVAIGQKAGLDFMMLADHMNLRNRTNGREGLYGSTLVVVGYEHNDQQDHHHYLLFDSPKVYDRRSTAAEYVSAGADDGALGILAHPDEIRDKLVEFPPYPWTDWSVDRFDGIELWNQMSEWMERLTRFNRLAMAFSPRKSMIGPTDRILAKWDAISSKRRCVGIAGVDAHAFSIKVGPFRVAIFPYKVHFRCLRTHLLLSEPMSDDFETARDQLYSALRNCRVFFSNMRWGRADGFEFFAENEQGRATCGDELMLKHNTVLQAKLPARATIKLVKSGEVVLTTVSDKLSVVLDQPGNYRLEAWRGRRGWIFSNHIRILPPNEGAQ
jgi:hypothetical protein